MAINGRRLGRPNHLFPIQEEGFGVPRLPRINGTAHMPPHPLEETQCCVESFDYPKRLETFTYSAKTALEIKRRGWPRGSVIDLPVAGVGFRFEADAVFSNEGDCRCKCCHFRQFVNSLVITDASGSGGTKQLGKKIGQDLDDMALNADVSYREDNVSGTQPYGYRQPFNHQSADAYFHDKKSGVRVVEDARKKAPLDPLRMSLGEFERNQQLLLADVVNSESPRSRHEGCYYWMLDDVRAANAFGNLIWAWWRFDGLIRPRGCSNIKGPRFRHFEVWMHADWSHRKLSGPSIYWSFALPSKLKPIVVAGLEVPYLDWWMTLASRDKVVVDSGPYKGVHHGGLLAAGIAAKSSHHPFHPKTYTIAGPK